MSLAANTASTEEHEQLQNQRAQQIFALIARIHQNPDAKFNRVTTTHSNGQLQTISAHEVSESDKQIANTAAQALQKLTENPSVIVTIASPTYGVFRCQHAACKRTISSYQEILEKAARKQQEASHAALSEETVKKHETTEAVTTIPVIAGTLHDTEEKKQEEVAPTQNEKRTISSVASHYVKNQNQE